MSGKFLPWLALILIGITGLYLLTPAVTASGKKDEMIMSPQKLQAQQEQLPTGVTFTTEAGGSRQYQIAHGMKLLLVENRVAPVATVLVVYRVGSRNEAVGHTGSTHLLEHMMFKGTPTFNKAANTQIAATLQKIGADFNANTWYDRTMYFETVPSD